MNSEKDVESLELDDSSEKGTPLRSIPIASTSKRLDNLNSKELNFRKRLKVYYERKSIDEFFKLLQRSEKVLFGRKFDQDTSLFEDILRTNNQDHAEFIRKIWINFKLWNNEDILTTLNTQGKLPIDYIIESGSSLNLICFLVYDFNTPNEVGSKNEKKYFLNLKNQQYIEKTGKTLFLELYFIIEVEKKNQQICIQIIEELLKSRSELIQDIIKDTSIDYVLNMHNLQDSTEILKLLVFYWDIEEKPDDFKKFKDILAYKSPFCEIILDLKDETKHTFKDLFVRYLNNMERLYKGYPNLHQTLLQKDRKYLLDHEKFSIKHRSYGNKYYIINDIPDNKILLDLHDDFIFTILSPKQKLLQDKIKNSSTTKDLEKILNTLDYQEVLFLLFARSQINPENLLEQMLSKPHNLVNDLLQNLCSVYELETFYTEKMLLMINPFGKQLIDYVIESGDERNLFAFLMSNFAGTHNKQSLLVLKNEQLKLKTKQTIFQKMYEIISKDVSLKTDCILVLKRLLHEMVEIDDIEFECDIETVMAMNPAHRCEILRLLVIYWKIDSSSYEKYKKHQFLNDKIYELMIMLKKGNDENFKDTFSFYIIRSMQQHREHFESHVQNDANILLTLALRYGQKRAMETIVTCQIIKVNKIQITTDKSVSTYEHINYLMKLMLKHGYNVHELNHSWVNVAVFEDSLDDRIIEEDQNNIIIDYKSFNNDNGSLINQDDNVSLFSCYNILNNRCMRNNMTHPVLSTIINLKALKYQRFYAFNFWIFIVIYMLPFFMLLLHQDELKGFLFWFIYLFCLFGTCFLIVREVVEYVISETYFRKLSNYLEIVLIVLSVLVLIIIPYSIGDVSKLLIYSSASLILLSTVEVLTFLPYPSMAIYMYMFKNVATTFWKFLLIFFLIIFAFAFSFCIVMKPVAVQNEQTKSNEPSEISKLELKNIIEKSLEKFDADGSISHNFENLHTSILKTLQMLSGEFTIEPFNLDNHFQKLLFSCFVITSIILFNLIIGLVISDIQDVKEQADFLFLQNQLENTLQTSLAISKFKNCTER
ncbi:unnamed protein product [Diamesa serratosioi]